MPTPLRAGAGQPLEGLRGPPRLGLACAQPTAPRSDAVQPGTVKSIYTLVSKEADVCWITRMMSGVRASGFLLGKFQRNLSFSP